MSKEFIEIKDEVMEAEETAAEIVDVTDEKPSFKEKAKGAFEKVKNSKAAKIAGGIGLVAIGALGALALAGNKSDDDNCIGDADYVVYGFDGSDETETTATE